MACSISQRVVAFTWEAAGCDDRDRGFQTLATVLFDDIKWSECHLHAQVCKLKNFSKEQGSLLGPRKWIERSGNWQRAFCCTALHCTALYCTVLYCTILHCTARPCACCWHGHWRIKIGCPIRPATWHFNDMLHKALCLRVCVYAQTVIHSLQRPKWCTSRTTNCYVFWWMHVCDCFFQFNS